MNAIKLILIVLIGSMNNINAKTYISKIDGKGLVEYVTVVTDILEEDSNNATCENGQEKVTIERLREMVENNEDYSKICTSGITNMSKIFNDKTVNFDITQWDVSNVTDMSEMFAFSMFNQDISKWNVKNVLSMKSMFRNSNFNQPIGEWNVSNVIDMSWMFVGNKSFNQNINSWNMEGLVTVPKFVDQT